MTSSGAYIVAARRTVLGRVGGVHRRRRIEEIAGPVIAAALADAGIAATQVDELLAGNVSAGGNPARLIALAAGLPETVGALTIDRQCASGLDAIVHGARLIATGEARVVVAGGAEALSTAPWRVAKPRTVYQTPHFESLTAAFDGNGDATPHVGAGETLARELQLTRETLDAYALKSHIRACMAHDAKRFLKEIVALRTAAEETRDESLDDDLEVDELAELATFIDGGRLTTGNTAMPHDGAAFAVLVAESVWRDLGRKPALCLTAGVTAAVAADREASAPIAALKKLAERIEGRNGRSTLDRFGLIELGETSAAQAIAVRDQLGIDEERLNPDGGAVARGLPLGAAGAVGVVRLFTRMARARGSDSARRGIAVQGSRGGQATAAAFEAA